MKIFIISHDLSHNCLGRALVLAEVFGRHHDVEVLGTAFGPDIWYPARATGIKYRKVEGELFLPQYTHLMARLIEKLKGDVILAVKPRPTSFGVALMRREQQPNRAVILDIDDDEMAFYADEDWTRWDPKVLLRRPNSPLYISLLERLIPTADAITCASRGLQQRYGGLYLPHVKDPAVLSPDRFDRERERNARDIPVDEKIVMFVGSPRPHKGLELLLTAIRRLERRDLKLLIVGVTNDPDDDFERRLRELGGDSLYMLKQSPLAELPALLSMADLVVLPQLDTPVSRMQMPSKLYDAMAMALPIIATDVSDIRDALAGECGIVVQPGDEDALVSAIGEILESPQKARCLGENARRRLIERYSIDAAQEIVQQVLSQVMGAPA